MIYALGETEAGAIVDTNSAGTSVSKAPAPEIPWGKILLVTGIGYYLIAGTFFGIKLAKVFK